MAKLEHRNLIRLLVYEFIPNMSLDRFLFDPIKRERLTWEKRYDIIVGISRGLLYLHEGTHLPIIHRDLKASNVLLDEQMQPKVSDFGMATQFDFDKTQETTRRVVGTYGYIWLQSTQCMEDSRLRQTFTVSVFLFLRSSWVRGTTAMDMEKTQTIQALLGQVGLKEHY